MHGRRKKLRMMRYSLPLLFLASVPLGFVLGGPWTFLSIPLIVLGMVGLNWLLGPNSDITAAVGSSGYRLVAWIYIPLQIAITVWATVTVTETSLTPFEAIGLTLSVGLTAGVFGMVTAHEMVHSPFRIERALGLSMLASVAYMHFRIAHIHGHHVRAATKEDPATARRGEGVYSFIARSVVGQVREAWEWEAARVLRRDGAVLSLSNRMIQYFAIELVILLAVATLGAEALLFFLAQALGAVLMLELFNYIAHYGLVRRIEPSGRIERLSERHSWNSSRQMDNWSLFNMGRHSDHHRFPTRSYQLLEMRQGVAELPLGYGGAILLALLPPLWRRVMDPKIMR